MIIISAINQNTVQQSEELEKARKQLQESLSHIKCDNNCTRDTLGWVKFNRKGEIVSVLDSACCSDYAHLIRYFFNEIYHS